MNIGFNTGHKENYMNEVEAIIKLVSGMEPHRIGEAHAVSVARNVIMTMKNLGYEFEKNESRKR